MSQIAAITQKINSLKKRSELLRAVRYWFYEQGFTELQIPVLVRYPGQEPNLTPLQTQFLNERGQIFQAFLHTSPEFTMKKCLAAGMEKIYSLGPVFRSGEASTVRHNIEFTMLEWYRAHTDMWSIMDDVEFLWRTLHAVLDKTPLQVQRVHMRDVWSMYAHLDLDKLLTNTALYNVCKKRGYPVKEDEAYEDLFYRIFIQEIEPRLPTDVLTIIHHYPSQMAALAEHSNVQRGYAERFEVYLGELEIGNAFTELTDAAEQNQRFVHEQQARAGNGKQVYPIDPDFLEAVEYMPESGGIAIGLDRLFAAALGTGIDSLIPLTTKEMFEQRWD